MLMCNTEVMKEIKKLEADREALLDYENKTSTVSYMQDEEPIPSNYDYAKVQGQIESLNAEIRRLRRLLALSNVTTIVEGFDMTISEALCYLDQLKSTERRLGYLVSREELTRNRPVRVEKCEYTKILYSREAVIKDYQRVKKIIPKLQMAIDRTNLNNMIEC